MANKSSYVLIKYFVVAAIIIATFVVFGLYISSHHEVIQTLKSLDLTTIILLAGGYTLITLVNAVILFYSLRFIKKTSSISDNIILTGYSSIVNFFGPLQSGPGFRAIYLKKKYGVRIRDFFITTLIFYSFFGIINVLILFVAGVLRFGLGIFYIYAIVGILILLLAIYLIEKRFGRVRPILQSLKLNDVNFWLIGVGAVALVLATVATYFVEIHHVNLGVSVTQTIVYTAAANLSLFVAITPGAIGIRESFLALSQQLHGINTTTIIGASVIDRAFYISFLALMFVALLAINSRKHLSIFKLKPRE